MPGCDLVRAGPLEPAELLEARVAHARELRRERAHLVPHILGGRVPPVRSKSPRELGHDPDLVARFARRLDRFAARAARGARCS